MSRHSRSVLSRLCYFDSHFHTFTLAHTRSLQRSPTALMCSLQYLVPVPGSLQYLVPAACIFHCMDTLSIFCYHVLPGSCSFRPDGADPSPGVPTPSQERTWGRSSATCSPRVKLQEASQCSSAPCGSCRVNAVFTAVAVYSKGGR
jgi:hypothetical protein